MGIFTKIKMNMELMEVANHLSTFSYNYFFNSQYEAHEHPMVETWNPMSFLLVFYEKNVFLMVIFLFNQIGKILSWMYITGVMVFEYRKLTGEVYLESYLRENPDLLLDQNEDADIFQEDDVM